MVITILIIHEDWNTQSSTLNIKNQTQYDKILSYLEDQLKYYLVKYGTDIYYSKLPAEYIPNIDVNIISFFGSNSRLMYSPSNIWHHCLNILRPEQKVRQNPIIYVEFNYHGQIYNDCKLKFVPFKNRIPSRMIKHDDLGMLIELSKPGIYGHGRGPTAPYRYCFLLNNGIVEPCDYKCQFLSEPLPESCPDIKDDMWCFSKYKNITAEFPNECPVCFETDQLWSLLKCEHLLCKQCARQLQMCPLCRKNYEPLEIYDV